MKMKLLGLLISGILLSMLFSMGFVSAIDKIVYPLYASDTCDISHSVFKADTTASQTLTQASTTYTCKINSICRVRNPTVSCPGPSIANLWLGYSVYWQISVKGKVYKSTVSSDMAILGQGVEFNEGDSITYSGACANNAKINLINIITALLGLGGSEFIQPTSSSLQIESKVATIWHDPALEGAYTVSGTEYCQYNNALKTFANNLPVNEQLGKTAAELARPGASNVPGNPIQELSDMTRFYIGTSKLSVDKYIELPFVYNVNPLGKYNGQDIICSQSKGIVSVVPLTTEGSGTYYVLGSRLKTSDFCCGNTECRNTYGLNYNCDPTTYTCKEIQGYCNNDLDCQPEGGTQYDTNCIQKSGKFYTWTSSCVSNKCSPYPAATTEVKCCPGYCSLTNQVCDTAKGCYTPTTPLSDCPPGMCCDGTTSKLVGCSTGQTCCYETDLHRGICKEQCVAPPECTVKEDCDKLDKCKVEGKDCKCENNKCNIYDVSNLKADCDLRATQQPLLGWQWVEKSTCERWCIIGLGKPTVEPYCKPTFAIYYVLLGSILIVFTITTVVIISKIRKKRITSPVKSTIRRKPRRRTKTTVVRYVSKK